MSNRPIAIYNSHNLTLSGSSTASPAVSTAAGAVRVVATVDVWVSLKGPAAVGTGFLLPAGHVEYLFTTPGTILSALPDNGTVGTVNIAEIG